MKLWTLARHRGTSVSIFGQADAQERHGPERGGRDRGGRGRGGGVATSVALGACVAFVDVVAFVEVVFERVPFTTGALAMMSGTRGVVSFAGAGVVSFPGGSSDVPFVAFVGIVSLGTSTSASVSLVLGSGSVAVEFDPGCVPFEGAWLVLVPPAVVALDPVVGGAAFVPVALVLVVGAVGFTGAVVGGFGEGAAGMVGARGAVGSGEGEGAGSVALGSAVSASGVAMGAPVGRGASRAGAAGAVGVLAAGSGACERQPALARTARVRRTSPVRMTALPSGGGGF